MSTPIFCPACKELGIVNFANNKEFYYCRTCKDEIMNGDTDLTDMENFISPMDSIYGDYHD